MLLVQSLITALLAGIFRWDSRCFGQNLLDEPIVVGMVLGLVLGDLKTGLYVGTPVLSLTKTFPQLMATCYWPLNNVHYCAVQNSNTQ